SGRGPGRQYRSWRRGYQLEGSGSRSLGHRGNGGSAHKVREAGCHRLSGPISHPRASKSLVQRVGTRVRSRRFTKDEDGNRPATQPHGRDGAKRGSRGRILPGRLLVFTASNYLEERVSGYWCNRKWYSGSNEVAALLDRYGEEFLPVMPRARLQGHAYAGEGMGFVHQLSPGMDPARTGWPGESQHGSHSRP